MKRQCRRSRWLIAALVALLWGSLGISCEDIVADPDASGPPVSLRVAADQDVFLYLTGFLARVDLVVTADQPFQAWNLEVTWDSDTVTWADAFPHPEFGDDRRLFGDTQFDADSLSNIVDLWHGDAAPSGTARVAMVWLYSETTEPFKVRVRGEVVTPDGTLFNVVVSESATVAP